MGNAKISTHNGEPGAKTPLKFAPRTLVFRDYCSLFKRTEFISGPVGGKNLPRRGAFRKLRRFIILANGHVYKQPRPIFPFAQCTRHDQPNRCWTRIPNPEIFAKLSLRTFRTFPSVIPRRLAIISKTFSSNRVFRNRLNCMRNLQQCMIKISNILYINFRTGDFYSSHVIS